MKALAVTSDTITLPRAEYEALREAAAERDRLREAVEALEDAEGIAALEDLETRLARDGAPGPNYLPVAGAERILAGESPMRVWREHRGLTLRELGAKANMPSSYLSEIETGKKPGSVEAWKAIAHALGVRLDTLVD
jgi:hypothetical protein